MSKKYQHVLSPIIVGNQLLKNRLIYPLATNHTLQGSEDFPADSHITFLSHVARNGASVVTVSPGNPPTATDRWVRYNLDDVRVRNYVSHLFDAIHFYGSKGTVQVQIGYPTGFQFSPRPSPPESEGQAIDVPGPFGIINQSEGYNNPIINEAQMDASIDELAGKLKVWKYCGADMVTLRIEKYLCCHDNLRTDKYGGSLENRARFPLRVSAYLKEKLGRDFLIEYIIFVGFDVSAARGIDPEEAVAFAKLLEKSGTVDLLTLRPSRGGVPHYVSTPTKPHEVLAIAEAIKKAGVKLPLSVTGGFQDPDLMEEAIAGGKTDLVSIGRGFDCEYDFGRKLREGRGDDVVPCVQCNKCHNYSEAGPAFHYCTVNPISGLQHKVGRMIDPPPATKKKVAVIGGGPAGMKAALVAAERGHDVTLFEKAAFLGGQLVHADQVDFKWTYKRFKEYLIGQVYKSGIKIHLNVDGTPEMVRQGGYDAVIAALGAVPHIPDIVGVKDTAVWAAPDVFVKENELGEKVVVIGGSVTGTEAAVYLAHAGHNVIVLTRQNKLCPEANRVHSILDCNSIVVKGGYEIRRALWDDVDGFSFIANATVRLVADGKVTYVNANGREHVIEADSIVIAGGMKAKMDEAMEFSGVAEEFYAIGDCRQVRNVAMAIRTAFEAAVMI